MIDIDICTYDNDSPSEAILKLCRILLASDTLQVVKCYEKGTFKPRYLLCINNPGNPEDTEFRYVVGELFSPDDAANVKDSMIPAEEAVQFVASQN